MTEEEIDLKAQQTISFTETKPTFLLFGHTFTQGSILQIVLDHSIPGSPAGVITRIGKLHEVNVGYYADGTRRGFLSLIPHGDEKRYTADIIGEMAIEPIDNIKEIIILKHG